MLCPRFRRAYPDGPAARIEGPGKCPRVEERGLC